MNRLPKVMATVSAIPLLVAMLLTATLAVALTPGFYYYQYNLLHQEQTIGCDRAELDRITVELIDYMSGKTDALETRAVINGQEREVYLMIDKLHMVDVRGLFTVARIAAPLCVILFLALLIPAALMTPREKRVRTITGSLLLGIGGFFVLTAALALYVALDFYTAFVRFHHIFFRNDLWLLPANSVLLQMMPTYFFMNLATIIGALFGGGVVLIVAILLIVRALSIRKEKKTSPIIAMAAGGEERFEICGAPAERPCAEEIFEKFGLSDEDDQPLLPDEADPAAAISAEAPPIEPPVEDTPRPEAPATEAQEQELPEPEATVQAEIRIPGAASGAPEEPVTLRVPLRLPISALQANGMTLELSIQLDEDEAGDEGGEHEQIESAGEPQADEKPEETDQDRAMQEILLSLDALLASLPEEA